MRTLSAGTRCATAAFGLLLCSQALSETQAVRVVQDFETEQGQSWVRVADAAVGTGAGATEQILKAWDGFVLRVDGAPAEADGITFWVRTDDGRTAALTVGLYEWDGKQQTEAFGTRLWASPTWQKHVLPFGAMQRIWARTGNDKFDREKVRSIQFQRLIWSGELRSTRLVFDQVEFVKGAGRPSVEPRQPKTAITVDAAKTILRLKRFWRAISPADVVEQNSYFEGPAGDAMRILGADRTFDYARIAWHVVPKRNPWLTCKYGEPIYTHDAKGEPVYNFTDQDALVDNILKCGLRPMMLLHGMPLALASDPKAQIYGGNICPPTDYGRWKALVKTFAQHYVEKYGAKEVEQWYWEIWNEPDLWWFSWMFKGKDAGFDALMQLYDHAAAGIIEALPKAKVGGPAIAGFPRDYSTRLLRHAVEGKNAATGQTGAPLTFLSHHCYDSAFGQMIRLYEARAALAKFGKLGAIEIQTTEYGDAIWGSRFGTRFQAASLCQTIDAHAYAARTDDARLDWLHWFGVLRGFSPDCDDYFTEPRPKARQQITTLFLLVKGTLLAKPVYNAYRMLSYLDSDWLEVKGAHFGDTVHAIATLSDDKSRLSILVYRHDWSNPDTTGAARDVELTLVNPPFEGKATCQSFRMDSSCSDIYAAWQREGSPPHNAITPEQVKRIKAHDELQRAPRPEPKTLHRADPWTCSFALDPHAIALFVFTREP